MGRLGVRIVYIRDNPVNKEMEGKIALDQHLARPLELLRGLLLCLVPRNPRHARI